MSNFEDDLNKLIDEDPLGLLDITPRQYLLMTADERLITSFQEINVFYLANNREPAEVKDIQERKLYSRLKGIRENPLKAESLKEFDAHGLLAEVIDSLDKLGSADDAISDDPLGILDVESDGIFDLKHVPKDKKESPDYIAKAKPCKDFADFEHLFKKCHKDLIKKERELRPFTKEQQIEKGMFFLLKGMLIYIAEVGNKIRSNKKMNARLWCIYENGTESDILLRSLAVQLYKDGRRVTEHSEKLLDGFNDISNKDNESGYIYILTSKSERPEIKNKKNLFKIGFTKNTTEQRIKGAKNDPTYLMADVHIVTEYQCYNMNAEKFENLVHKFFAEVCLDADIVDGEGNLFKPKEWFIAPFEIIEQAIHYIISGEIVNLRYDSVKQEIVNG